MNKKGFTLVELLGTVVILALIVAVAFPTVISQLKRSNNEIDSATASYIESAARQYVNENVNDFPKPNSARQLGSITANDLIEKGYMDESFKEKYSEYLDMEITVCANSERYVIKLGKSCMEFIN